MYSTMLIFFIEAYPGASLTSPAGKLDILLDLLQNGFLCTCNEVDETWDEYDCVYKKEIRHKKTCDARVKAMALLQEENNG